MKQLTIAIFTCISSVVAAQTSHFNAGGKTVRERIVVPPGFTRVATPAGSFAAYVQQLPLLPQGTEVHYYNGSVKPNNDIYAAVIDLPIGNKNLQQCADVIMHIRADYCYKSKQPDKIKFTFTSGFLASYERWRQGYRIAVNGNKAIWVKKGPPADSYAILAEFMDVVYTYCGTLSLSRELIKIPFSDIRPGDLLIKGGSPGHAELIVDVALDKLGNKIFLLAQSYMPAQQMQLLVNRQNRTLSPWYEAKGNDISTPEWAFTSDQVMRFAD